MFEHEDVTRQVFQHNKVPTNTTNFAAYWQSGWKIGRVQDQTNNIENQTAEQICKRLEGDCFNPVVNDQIDPLVLHREREAYKQRIRRERVWGLGLVSPEGKPLWETFVWGFVGQDYLGSGYDAEMIEELPKRAGNSILPEFLAQQEAFKREQAQKISLSLADFSQINEANETNPTKEQALANLTFQVQQGETVGGPLVQMFEDAAKAAGASPKEIRQAIQLGQEAARNGV